MNEFARTLKGFAAGGAALLALTACATSPIPNEKIAVARASVQRAEQSGAQEAAPVELSTARDNLQRAEKAVADHDAEPATMLAEQANVDAELAEATAQQHRSHKAEMELEASLQALRDQANQPSPASSPLPAAPQPITQ
jgi:hypothetical protein